MVTKISGELGLKTLGHIAEHLGISGALQAVKFFLWPRACMAVQVLMSEKIMENPLKHSPIESSNPKNSPFICSWRCGMIQS